ncbi:hypothetical protein NQ317_008476 [Molorchus minor]|uniref:DUF4371 domain-containing protein n=1 Tax=Molorchus minor TaxID=1323400 RepID=A0ABQ9JCV1_9CUCU|nr:hypothetical protein NQ317_008476 [Molorchus minor]
MSIADRNIFGYRRCQKYQLKANKSSECIIYTYNIIASSYIDSLTMVLQNNKFSVLIDESTDIAVMKTACIDTTIWELIPLFNYYENADTLYQSVIKTFTSKKISLDNIVGFVSDGYNLMMGSHNSVLWRFKASCPGIVIMKCITRCIFAAVRHVRVFREIARIWY